MYRPRIFIGSSSSPDALDVAAAVQEQLEYDHEPTIWHQSVFSPTRDTLGDLERELLSSDAGIFIFMPEDTLQVGSSSMQTVRDNVVFELGISSGRLGSENSFFLVPRHRDIHIPTDLVGITPLSYEPRRSDNRIEAAVGPACTKVRRKLRENFNFLDSTSGESGLEGTIWLKGETTEEVRFIDASYFIYRPGSASEWKLHKYSFRRKPNTIVLHWKNGEGTYNANCLVGEEGLSFLEPKSTRDLSDTWKWYRKMG